MAFLMLWAWGCLALTVAWVIFNGPQEPERWED